MNRSNLFLIIIVVVLFHLIAGTVLFRLNDKTIVGVWVVPETPEILLEPSPPVESKPNITEIIPKGQLSYDGMMQWLDRLHQEAPDQTEVGVVGKSSSGREIKYIKIGPPNDGPKVLITSCVHGNEKLCAAVAVACISRMLSDYMVDDEVTELLRTRQLYYIPIVCPDGYSNNSRHEDGLDPNRNWNGKNLTEMISIHSVQAVKTFFLEHDFPAVMSCHNYGRIYFIPWGYNQQKSEVYEEYARVLKLMSKESGYSWEQLLRQSAPPYYGYEADWYHKHGAFSFVNEIGHNFTARPAEIESEVEDNYPAFLIYLREAPLIMK